MVIQTPNVSTGVAGTLTPETEQLIKSRVDALVGERIDRSPERLRQFGTGSAERRTRYAAV